MHNFTNTVQVTLEYFWNHSSNLDTLVHQNSNAATIKSSVRGRTGFSKSRGLRASVPFFPFPQPATSTFLLSPHLWRGPNAKTSFARPKFRSHRLGTLATQARDCLNVKSLLNDVIFVCHKWQSHKKDEIGGLLFFDTSYYLTQSKTRNTIYWNVYYLLH